MTMKVSTRILVEVKLLVLSLVVGVFAQQGNFVNILLENVPECTCRMAIDVAYVRPNCVGSRLVLRPHDPSKPSQQWKREGNMFINRLNGFAITVNDAKQLVLGHKMGASNQKFTHTDKRLQLEKLFENLPHFVDTERKTGNPINTPLVTNPKNPFTTDQLWELSSTMQQAPGPPVPPG